MSTKEKADKTEATGENGGTENVVGAGEPGAAQKPEETGGAGAAEGTWAAGKAPLRSPLGVLATATATHDTGQDGDIALPRLPGFVESAFSPLVFEVAARCLTECPGDGGRMAVALASLMGDTTTADLASRRVVSGRVHNPLLFMQATANSVLGHLSREFGITGLPKGVPHTHRTLMYAQSHRLRYSTGTDMERTLVGLPGAHNAMVATLLYCLLLRADIKLLSSQRGTDVLDAIEEFRPTTVLAFAGTFGEMAAEDLTARDLSSVQVWFNTGDAAHEAHIRALVRHGGHVEIGRDLKRVRVDGSVFVDGLGSSEAGYSVFHNRHTKETSAYSRRVGKPISFAEAAVLAEDGTPLPPGEIGRLGLKSPTLTPGYWNDSVTWNRTRLGGYWLTGDLAHQDEEGNFYHLDRAPDAIRTRVGIVFSTRTEELLLAELPGLTDCTVVGVAPDGVRADWDGDGVGEAYALLQLVDEEGAEGEATEGGESDEVWTERVNAVLTGAGFPPLSRALRMKPDDVAKGATGKVLKRVMRDRFAAKEQHA